MNKKIILVGGFHEIIELAENNSYEIIGIIDNILEKEYRNYKIICNDSEANNINFKYKNIPIIITPDQPIIRKQLFNHYNSLKYTFTSLISKKANISKSSVIQNGCVIQDFVNVSAMVDVGRFVKLNTMCNIMHNTEIGDFTTIAPNAVILGHVKIGKNCYIGSNSTILPYISICDNVTIGAGAVITKNVDIPGTYIGIPAKLV